MRSHSHFLNSIVFADKLVPSSAPLYSRHVRLGGRGLPLLPHSLVNVYILQHPTPHSTAAQPVVAGAPPAGFSPSCGPATENSLRRRRRPSTTTACLVIKEEKLEPGSGEGSLLPSTMTILQSGSRLLVTPTGMGLPPYRRQINQYTMCMLSTIMNKRNL